MNYYKDSIEEGNATLTRWKGRNLWRCNPSRFNKVRPGGFTQYRSQKRSRRISVRMAETS
ncbi:MAG: hypothetical protein ACLR0U_16310 [Enterocloster clostridioformis]